MWSSASCGLRRRSWRPTTEKAQAEEAKAKRAEREAEACRLGFLEAPFGGAAFLFVLLLLWGPISYLERRTTILAFAVLAALGVEALRRRAARDAPASSSASGARQPFALRRTPSQAEKLERLVRLHDAGGLTDDEFEAGKARVLSAVSTRRTEDVAGPEGGGV